MNTAANLATAGPERFAGFLAGAAKRKITPDPAQMADKQRLLTVRDQLFVRALVLEASSGTVALVSLDIQLLPNARALRERIAAVSGLPPESVFLWPSHTHRVPDNNESGYWEWVAEETALAVSEARRNLQPAEWGFVQGEAPLNVNRYARVDGKGVVLKDPSVTCNEYTQPVDPALGVLSLRSQSRQPLALLYFYSGVPHILDSRAGFSADFPGEVANLLEAETGRPVLFANGAVGDLDIRFNQAGEATLQASGNTMAAAIRNLLPRIAWRSDFVPYVRWEWLEMDGKRWRVGALRFAQDVALICVPCDLDHDLGLEIKRRSPFRHTLITLGRSVAGEDGGNAVPSRRSLALEVPGRNWQPPEWGDLFVERSLALLAGVAEGKFSADVTAKDAKQ